MKIKMKMLKSKLYLKIKETRCPRGRIKRIYTESMLVVTAKDF
jgi:hypothetical protein